MASVFELREITQCLIFYPVCVYPTQLFFSAFRCDCQLLIPFFSLILQSKTSMFLCGRLSQTRHYAVKLYSVFTLRSANSLQDRVCRKFNNFNLMAHPVPFFSTSTKRSATLKMEPDDVGLPPEIPEYDKLALRIKGHDFTVLEKFTKYAHSILRFLQFETECYPMPCKSIDVNTYRLNSTIIDKSYNLDEYERVILVNDLPNTKLTSLIYLLTVNTPEGVNFVFNYPSPSDEENRYIPDRQLLELQGQLEEMAIAKKKKKK